MQTYTFLYFATDMKPQCACLVQTFYTIDTRYLSNTFVGTFQYNFLVIPT